MHFRRSVLFTAFITVFYAATAGWASAQDLSAQATLAALVRREALAHEHGEGVPRDLALAAQLYCQSARLGDAQAQYNLGWMYANGRGVARHDASAAFFFNAAAAQGVFAAQRMLPMVGQPGPEVPECMQNANAAAPATTTAPPRPAQAASAPGVNYQAIAPRKIFELVTQLAPQFKVEPQLALAIIAAESNFDSLALSPRNAQGLMQLIPETSERFNVKNAFDPVQNIRGGLRYLRWLLAYFEGDVALVAAAYNAGEGKVERYRGVPPYLETQAYVRRILQAVGTPAHPFDASAARPSPALPLIKLAWQAPPRLARPVPRL